MSETRLSSFALKALTGKEKTKLFFFFRNKIFKKQIDSLTDGLTNLENRKRLQATRALFMTIERRQVKEASLLTKQNKEMQRLEKEFIKFSFSFSHLVLLNLKKPNVYIKKNL
jgi:Iap family predicted aminopeptidase